MHTIKKNIFHNFAVNLQSCLTSKFDVIFHFINKRKNLIEAEPRDHGRSRDDWWRQHFIGLALDSYPVNI